MNTRSIRTDLALEAQEALEPVASSIHGICVSKIHHEESGADITKVEITTKNGAKAIGKPMGTYITIEAPALDLPDEDYHRNISLEISHQLKTLIPDFETEQSILVVGLGNRNITADSLGPTVTDHLYITRHLVKEYGKEACLSGCGRRMHILSSLAPGVMAQTGMETSEIIEGVVKKTKPDLMIVIDSLAARSIRRLNRTIQISNSGIQPGSGVGNHRNALNKESLGIPVIAIGVPIVVDAATIVKDAAGDNYSTMAELNNMYVTCKDVDTTVDRLSFTISEALNLTMAE
ncbi:MAG: GPR endopeptidase [Lachnospiraceae bacterium]|jgi:spore protease|nr:GPR endopeptidase [Lachnospiraceae bacterium]